MKRSSETSGTWAKLLFPRTRVFQPLQSMGGEVLSACWSGSREGYKLLAAMCRSEGFPPHLLEGSQNLELQLHFQSFPVCPQPGFATPLPNEFMAL